MIIQVYLKTRFDALSDTLQTSLVLGPDQAVATVIVPHLASRLRAQYDSDAKAGRMTHCG